VIIFEAKSLINYFRRWKDNANCLDDYFQVIGKVSLHYRKPIVHNEFIYTSGEELFQPKFQNHGAKFNLTLSSSS
jgi:hypothetical protein